MARIYFQYAKNTLLEYPDFFMLVLFAAVSFVLVSLGDVLTNIPKDNFPNMVNFTVAAVRDTSWIIQALIAGFVIRVAVSGFKLAHRNMNTNWIIAKLRY